MPLPLEGQFDRRLQPTGACSTTCLRCRASVGFAFWEFELDELEARHVCGLGLDDSQAASARPPRKPVRPELLPDPATPRRHGRRLGRAARLGNANSA